MATKDVHIVWKPLGRSLICKMLSTFACTSTKLVPNFSMFIHNIIRIHDTSCKRISNLFNGLNNIILYLLNNSANPHLENIDKNKSVHMSATYIKVKM